MKKSCNRCRAFIVNGDGSQGCGLGFSTKLIAPVFSSSAMAMAIIIAPDECCTPIKNLADSIFMDVSRSKVKRWWSIVDYKNINTEISK